MSTYWHFECLSHDPALTSEEFTQHTDDAYFAAGIRLVGQRPLNIDWNEYDYNSASPLGYFTLNAMRFLDSHPNCNIGIVNEYGVHRVVEVQKQAVPHFEYQQEKRGPFGWFYTKRVECLCDIGKNHWTVNERRLSDGS